MLRISSKGNYFGRKRKEKKEEILEKLLRKLKKCHKSQGGIS
jgi:hypothetical protein